MIDPAERSRPGTIERQVTTAYAREMVARALYEVILDGVEYSPRDLPTGEDRDWIRGAIAMPIQEATDVALHVLAWRVTQALDRAPNGLLRRLDSSHLGVEVGSE
jgi:hypothetical protein